MQIITTGMIKSFEECPIKYDLIYKKNVEIPSDDEFAEKGKKIHTLINYKFKNSDITKFVQLLEQEENADLKTMWDNFLSLNINNCIESEFTFNVPLLQNIRLAGRTDTIIKTDKGYEILDWKTGKSSNITPEEDWQTIVYLYGIYELFKFNNKIKNYEELSMTYHFLKENIKKTIKYTEELHTLYKKQLTEICTKMEKFKNINSQPNKKCQKCNYNIICEKAY